MEADERRREHLARWIKVEDGVKPLTEATLQDVGESVSEHKARIKKMRYPRWSEERMKRAKGGDQEGEKAQTALNVESTT